MWISDFFVIRRSTVSSFLFRTRRGRGIWDVVDAKTLKLVVKFLKLHSFSHAHKGRGILVAPGFYENATKI